MRNLTLLCLSLILSNPVFANEYELTSPARSIPLPAAASDQLQEAIRTWPAPDVANAEKVPASEAEWLTTIAKSDEQWDRGVLETLAESSIKVKPVVIAGVDAYRVTPARILPANQQRLFLFLHGGAYVQGGGIGGTGEAILIAERIGIEVISVDYRMPPGNPFPAALDDSVAVYQELIKSRSPQTIALGGTSAGGGLSLAVVHKLQELSIELPGAIFAGTPWSDLTKTGDTLFTNEGLDRVLVTYDGVLSAAARLYAGKHDLKDPLISPLYGDFTGFPPTILITGTRDMFLSDVARTHRKLRAVGVTADLHVYEGMSHAGYIVSPDTPESEDMYKEVGAFLDKHLE